MLKRLTSSLFGAILLTTAVLAQAPPKSYNTTLYGELHPQSDIGGRYSSLWGYAAPNGREYALLGGFFGTYIIDVTAKPVRQVAFIEGPPSGWREMKTYGHYAYVVTEGGGGLQIIDLSGLPESATLVRSDTTHFRTGHTISQYKNFIFINGANPDALSNGGSLILEVGSDPENPKLAGAWMARYVHDATIRNDTMYAAAINHGRLDIIHLGEAMSPTYLTSIEYPGAGTHNSDVTEDGSYIMTTDEINATPKTLKVWDRRDLNNITKVADYTPVPGQVIHNVHTKGRFAYVAWYTAGTRIIDMSVPTAPAEVGYYDTHPGASGDYAGNWEVYPYLPSGKILASDMQTGLHVFTFNGARRGAIHGVVRDAVTGEPVPNATIRIGELGRTIIADGQGRYRYAGAVDTLAFTASALNYYTGNGALHLSESDTEYDIRLTSFPLAKFSISPIDNKSGEAIPAFAYRIVERPFIDERSTTNPQALALPEDSTYHIYVGAWGYLPTVIEVKNPAGVITVALNRGYLDNAELDLGWSLAAPTDNALGGRWERGIPVLTDLPDGMVAQPGADHTDDPGAQAFITGIANSEAGIGANDVDDGITTLTSPPMDLTSFDDPIIFAALWYSRDIRTDAINDTLRVLISNDNGASWTVMASLTESPQRWEEYRFRVKDFVAPGERTLFRVEASDLHDQSLVEAGLDDFMVVDGSSSVPEAPVTGLEGVRSVFHPNPFTGTATLGITLPAAQRHASLELFDAGGRRVATLHEGALSAGTSSFAIDGAGLPSGRYTWRLLLDNGSALSGAATLLH